MPEIVSRKEALIANHNKYFTGVPCRNGHVAERYVQSGTCEDCIRQSRAIVISPRNTEIIAPDRELSPMRAAVLELKRQELSIQERKLALRESEHQITTFKLQERGQRQARKVTVKSRLTEVILIIHPLDYFMLTHVAWAMAVSRDSLLRLEDVVTGKERSDDRHILNCFPEDKAELLKLAADTFALRNAPIQAEIEQKLLEVRSSLDTEAEAAGDWPEGDPT